VNPLFDEYLKRLGVNHDGPPSAKALHELHEAHVERVPYETFDLFLSQFGVAGPPGIDPLESVRRIAVDQRGGYCYHLNGAFSTLLASLGYRVSRHLAGVHGDPAEPPRGADGNHLGVIVENLPDYDNPGGRWLVDVGLGDAIRHPLPLVPEFYRQGPFRYEIEESTLSPGGWRLVHDPRGSFVAVDIAAAPATMDDFADWHHRLSTSPDSPFVRTPTAQRRHATGVDIIRGCVFTRVTADGGHRRVLTSPEAWFPFVEERFGLTFDDDTRAVLWPRLLEVHEQHAIP
jgi:N-hydroxyarylamine O-acetyltransferase